MSPEKAISRFCLAEEQALARRFAHRLRRMKAAGVYDDACGHRTIWDEFCFEVQEGPTQMLAQAWDALIYPAALDVVKKCPRNVQAILSWNLESMEHEGPEDTVNEEALIEATIAAAKELAAR